MSNPFNIDYGSLWAAVDIVEDTARDTLSFTGLDGDLHGMYEIFFSFIFNSVSWDVEMHPNGAESDLLGILAANNSSPGQATDWSFCASGGGAATPGWCCGRLVLFAARTVKGVEARRCFSGSAGNFTNATSAGSAGQREAAGIWRSNDANLTTLDLVSSVDFQPGSFALVRQSLDRKVL